MKLKQRPEDFQVSESGRFDEFLRHGGTSLEKRGSSFPKEFLTVPGHPYHSTAQAKGRASFSWPPQAWAAARHKAGRMRFPPANSE